MTVSDFILGCTASCLCHLFKIKYLTFLNCELLLINVVHIVISAMQIVNVFNVYFVIVYDPT